ncbi:MAG: phytanoyl-CoA dioxygenase family protein, partial [Gammaproteobacteria bacterium]|nr:phytanoyl-CoA dioxygenase family protein [Gammaproteobacteria bacterium]
MLTEEQVAEFHREGFVLVPGLLEPAQRERYNARFLDIAAGNAPPEMTVMRDVMVVKGAVTPKTPVHGINKIMNLETDPILFDYARHPATLAIAQQLPVYQRLYTISTKLFIKPPDIDGRPPLHPDM